MGSRRRPAGDRGRAASRKTSVSRQRFRRPGENPHWGKTPWFSGAREADALSFFPWSLARNSSWNERTATRRERRDLTWQTRSSGAVPGKAEPYLFRSPDVRTRSVRARQEIAGVVE